MSRWSVVLCGYYGMGNLGDELLAQSCIQRLTAAGLPRQSLAILSGSPQESQEIHGVMAVNRWSPREVWRTLRESKSLLLGGGGLFQDSTSLRNPFYYWGLVRMAHAAGCRPWALGQSIGPLASPVSRALAKDALGLCRVRAVRDDPSLAQLHQMGYDGYRSGDLVLGLGLDLDGEPGGKPRFLVNLRPWDGQLELRAAEALRTLEVSVEVEKIGLALAPQDRDLMQRLVDEQRLQLDRILLVDPRQVSQAFAGAQGAFGMRLHFGVLALLAQVPCSLVPYDPKVESFALDWDLPLWTGGPLRPGLSPQWEKLCQVRGDLDRLFRRCLNEVMS